MKAVLNILISLAKVAAILACILIIMLLFRGDMHLKSEYFSGEAANENVQRSIVSADLYKPIVGTYGGTLRIGTLGEPKSFNPITSGETSTSQYTSHFFLGLTSADSWTFQPKGELATSWDVDESGLVWTVKLRQGVLWSDGHRFSADDVLFTYDLIYDERYVCSTRSSISGPNGEKWKLRKIDDYTVEFTLYDLNAIFPSLLSTEILPKHKYSELARQGKFNEALGPNTPPDDIVGTGPFILEKFEPSRQVVLKRNPNYYRKDEVGNSLPYIDRIVYVICKSTDVLSLKFDQGQTDIFSVPGAEYPVFMEKAVDDNFKIYRLGPAAGSSFVFLNMNPGEFEESGEPFVEPHKLKWFSDVRFRRSVSHCINREFIISSVMNGLGYPQYGPMNSAGNYFYGHPDIPKYPYDTEKAKALLDEMGLKDRDGDGIREDSEGNKLSFTLTTNSENNIRKDIASIIKQELDGVGMEVNFRPMNFNALVGKLGSGEGWEACLLSLTGGPEPHYGANVWRSSGRLHMWYPAQKTPATEWEAEIDDIFAEGIKELDLEKRKKIYYRWQEIVGQQQPLMYTATPESLVALRNRFGNVFPAPFGGVVHNLDEIFIVDDAKISEQEK